MKQSLLTANIILGFSVPPPKKNNPPPLTELQEAGPEHDQAGEEGQQGRHLRVAMVTVLVRHQRHDGRRTDRDGLRRAEDAVDEAAHERAVQAILQGRTVWSHLYEHCDTTNYRSISRYLSRTVMDSSFRYL